MDSVHTPNGVFLDTGDHVPEAGKMVVNNRLIDAALAAAPDICQTQVKVMLFNMMELF